MKKVMQKYKVIREMTKGDIVGLIGANWFYKNIWAFIILCIAATFADWGIGRITGNDYVAHNVFILIIAVVFIVFFIKGWIVGKKYWNKVKDTEQPFEIK